MDEVQMTHFVGDNCQPDGHRAERAVRSYYTAPSRPDCGPGNHTISHAPRSINAATGQEGEVWYCIYCFHKEREMWYGQPGE